MRWERLVADLAAQAASEELRQQETQIAEMRRLFAAEATMQEQFLEHIGSRISLTCAGCSPHQRLELIGVGKDWLYGRSHGQQVIVHTRHLVAWEVAETPVQGHRGNPGAAVAKKNFRAALRALVQQRATVTAMTACPGVQYQGTLDQVGMDFVRIAVHPVDEFRRESAVRAQLNIALEQLSQLQFWAAV